MPERPVPATDPPGPAAPARPGSAFARELRALRDVMRNPALARLQVAALLTALADWGSALALGVYAYERGGPSAVGIVALLRLLPGAPVAPYLTLLADRHARASMLVATNAARAALLAATAAAIAAGAPLAAVYLLVAALAVAAPAYRPAAAGLLPVLARTPSELSASNVAAALIANLGFLTGSMLTGALLAATSPQLAIGVLAAVFAASLAPLRGMPRETGPGGGMVATPRERGDVLGGFRFVAGDRRLRLIVLVRGIWSLLDGALDVLVVLAALGFLAVGEAGAGYLNSAWGAGAALGSVGVLALLSRGRLALGVGVGALVMGVALVIVPAVPVVAVAVLALAVFGAGATLVEVATDTLLQRLAPDHVLTRVMGVVETLFVVTAALGALGAGMLAAAAGTEATFVAAGCLMPLVVVLRWRSLARLEAGSPVPGREYGLLRAHPIFAPLPVATCELIARRLSEQRPEAGAAVVTQGEGGDRFYLVAAGELTVAVDGVPRRALGPGDGFGEIALLRAIPRTATVTAGPDAVLLALERADFLEAVTGLAQSRRAADAIAADRLGPAAPPG